jgi:hypothetical protein
MLCGFSLNLPLFGIGPSSKDLGTSLKLSTNKIAWIHWSLDLGTLSKVTLRFKLVESPILGGLLLAEIYSTLVNRWSKKNCTNHGRIKVVNCSQSSTFNLIHHPLNTLNSLCNKQSCQVKDSVMMSTCCIQKNIMHHVYKEKKEGRHVLLKHKILWRRKIGSLLATPLWSGRQCDDNLTSFFSWISSESSIWLSFSFIREMGSLCHSMSLTPQPIVR